MINVFKVKKWAAFLIAGMFPTVIFYLFLTIYKNFLYAIGAWFVMVFLVLLIGFRMINNPFSAMLEGNGLLSLNLDSKGNIGAFIVGMDRNSLLRGFSGSSEVSSVFDRDNVHNLSAPVVAGGSAKIETDNKGSKFLVYKLTEKEINDSRFAFNQFPVLIYNELSDSFIKKSELASMEKERIGFDKLTQLNKSVERLANYMFGFTRTIGDYFKPSSGLFGGGLPTWVIVIIVVLVGFLVVMLIVKGSGGSINLGGLGQAVSAAKTAAPPITPVG